MHLNVDARDRKSIAVLISTGCLPLEGRFDDVLRRCGGQKRSAVGVARVAVDRGLCSISLGIQQPRCARKRFRSVFRHAKKPRHSRAGLAFVIRCWETSHTGPMESEAERSICRADSALRDRVVGAVAEGGEKKVVDIWGRGVRRGRAQMRGENSVGFDSRYSAAISSARKSAPRTHPLRGPLPPGVPWGGVYFRITLSANAFRNAHVEHYMHRSSLAYRGPFAVHRSIRVR